MYKIKISDDFSDTPGARYYTDGDYSGQEFYEKILRKMYLKAKKDDEKLIINFDDCYGFASSFISESFGMLSFEYGKDDVRYRLKFVSEQDPLLIEQVINEINDPKRNRNDQSHVDR